MAGPRLFTGVIALAVTLIAGLPGHSLLKVTLDMDTTSHEVTKLCKVPDPLETSMHPDR